MLVWAKCLSDVCRGQRKEIALCDDIWGTSATEEEVQERCSWVLKLIDQMGFNVNLNMAQLKQPQVKCPDFETGETRRWINARKVKCSVKLRLPLINPNSEECWENLISYGSISIAVLVSYGSVSIFANSSRASWKWQEKNQAGSWSKDQDSALSDMKEAAWKISS